jgi:limonene-1,2-epoxide hydrolase
MTTPTEFPQVFAEGWARPKPQAFLDHFLPLVHQQATFAQPMFPDAHGPAQVERLFRRFFALFPDIELTVRRTAVQGDTVFIESDCTATLGRGHVAFAVCDRFVLCDGELLARRAYYDPLPVLLSAACHPAAWYRLLRSRTTQSASP